MLQRNTDFLRRRTIPLKAQRYLTGSLVPEADALRNAITIRNPLGPEFAVMRTISLNGILASLSTNYNRKNKNVRLFEIANVYIPKALPR